jgi:alpha-L-arabinofuranosidase
MKFQKPIITKINLGLAIVALLSPSLPGAEALQASISIAAEKPRTAVSPTLYGIFYEDINYAADGGLYAEMVQNRSFEYHTEDKRAKKASALSPLCAWISVERKSMTCRISTATAHPLNERNPTYATLTLAGKGEAGVANTGYHGGIPVKAGAIYDVSLYARRGTGATAPLTVAIETADGTVLAQAILDAPGAAWAKQQTSLTVSRDEPKARLVVTTSAAGSLDLDMVSLFPRDTFKGRKNGLRKDLAEAIAAMHPTTVRFPGGCIVHGNGLANAYRWKDTVGDVATRKPNWSRWGYYQSYGLGYFEYMLFCEDIGAAPLPILPCGVSCGFLRPYQVAPEGELAAWIQDCVDLVEFANGPVTSTWGKVRADMGHPAPFNLRFVGIGNEEHDTPKMREYFPRFVAAMRAKCPDIQIVGTSGLGDEIPLFDLMSATGVDITDEHYYKPPQWFIDNRHRFDTVVRKAPKIYVGEYASHSNTQLSAVAEAVYLTGIERNSDQVVMTAYAPLLARIEDTPSRKANLIWFDGERVFKTPSYYVQQLFGSNLGDQYLANTVAFPDAATVDGKPPVLAVSPTLANKDGKLFIKVANPMAVPITARVTLQGLSGIQTEAQLTTLAGDKAAINSLTNPRQIAPVVTTIPAGASFNLTVPAMSVQILQLGVGKS